MNRRLPALRFVAIKATARDLAYLVYLMVTEGQKCVEQASIPTSSGTSTEYSLISNAKPESSGSNASRRRKTRKGKTKFHQLLRHLLLKRKITIPVFGSGVKTERHGQMEVR